MIKFSRVTFAGVVAQDSLGNSLVSQFSYKFFVALRANTVNKPRKLRFTLQPGCTDVIDNQADICVSSSMDSSVKTLRNFLSYIQSLFKAEEQQTICP